MKYSFFAIISLLSLSSIQLLAENEGVISWEQNKHFSSNKKMLKQSEVNQVAKPSASERQTALTYLNVLRTSTGMIPYILNDKLNIASQNHADYLLEESIFSHHEDNNSNTHYTGLYPWDRGTYANYSYSTYSENISAGNSSLNSSIDSLFSAIYHRLGFLSFNTKEVGIGSINDNNYIYQTAYVYNMATDNNTNTSDVQNSNPDVVQWPSNEYLNAQPAFFNTEFPDPLPECKQGGPSGNPISIQFNPNLSFSPVVTSFNLTDEQGNPISTKLLSSENDPAVPKHLSDKDFVIFPIERLKWDSNYTASFNYTVNGESENKTWSFKTRALTYPILTLNSTNTTYEVAKNATYAFYTIPNDCNDTNTYYSSYSPSNLSLVGNWVDKNTHYIKIVGETGVTTTLRLGNGKEFNIHIFTEEVSALTFSNITSNAVTLNWVHTPQDNNDNQYKIYRDGVLIHTTDADALSYTDSNLESNKLYTYEVKVFDGSSESSGIKKTVTTLNNDSNTIENDINKDGISDMILRRDDGTYIIYFLNSDGSIGSEKLGYKVPNTWTLKDVNDFNNDGIADILWRHDDGRYLIYFLNTAGSVVSYKTVAVSTDWKIQDSGDINKDGISDIVLRRDDGTYLIYFLNSDGSIGSEKLGYKVPNTWTLKDVNDFNNDGIADILWRHDDGRYLIYFLNTAGSVVSYKVSSIPTEWAIQ